MVWIDNQNPLKSNDEVTYACPKMSYSLLVKKNPRNYQTDLLCIVPSHQTHPGRHGGNNKWTIFKHSLVIDIWRISWKVDTGRDDFIDYEAPNFWLGAIRHQDILSNKSDKDPQYWKASLWHNELTGNSMWNVVIANKSLKIIIELKNHICLDFFIHLQGSWFMKIFFIQWLNDVYICQWLGHHLFW